MYQCLIIIVAHTCPVTKGRQWHGAQRTTDNGPIQKRKRPFCSGGLTSPDWPTALARRYSPATLAASLAAVRRIPPGCRHRARRRWCGSVLFPLRLMPNPVRAAALMRCAPQTMDGEGGSFLRLQTHLQRLVQGIAGEGLGQGATPR